MALTSDFQNNSCFKLLLIGRFTSRQVHVKWDKTTPGPSPRLKAKIDKYWLEQNQKNKNLFNGDLCCLSAWKIFKNKLILNLGNTNYKQLLYSNSIREINRDSMLDFNPRALGISTVLVSGDGNILLMQRSALVGECPNLLDVFGGHIEPGVHSVDGVPDPFVAIAAEVVEEVGLEVSAHSFTCTGLLETTVTEKPELIFTFTSELPAGELIRLAEKENSDEIAGLTSLPNRITDLAFFLQTNGSDLSPSAFGALWIHLQNLENEN